MALEHLTIIYKLYQTEKQLFRKIHRMVDLYESILKTCTAVILAEYFKKKNISDSVKKTLVNVFLRPPTLGKWNELSNIIFKELNTDRSVFYHPEFKKSFKWLNGKAGVIMKFRNELAHGATPSDIDCEEYIVNQESILEELINQAWICESSLAENEGKVYITHESEDLCLDPIMIYESKSGKPFFTFINKIDNDKSILEILNYSTSSRMKSNDYFHRFHASIPINEWNTNEATEFQQKINDLTYHFAGRQYEIDQVIKFVSNRSKGIALIKGHPGYGKSAFIAKISVELTDYGNDQWHVIPYFIQRGNNNYVRAEYLLDYLNAYTNKYCKELIDEIPYNHHDLLSRQSSLIKKWIKWSEYARGKQRKLVYLIDGLDEAVEGQILEFLPKDTFEGVYFIYGSRPDGNHKFFMFKEALIKSLPQISIDLPPLTMKDIREILTEVVSKYAIDRDSKWIDALVERSKGLPLYMTMFCNDLKNGKVKIDDIDSVPGGLYNYYDVIWNRYESEGLGQLLKKALYVFTAAKEPLIADQLADILSFSGLSDRVIATLKEVLEVKILPSKTESFGLFHDTFRQYIQEKHPSRVKKANECLIEYCSRWSALEGDHGQSYALEHYADHLLDSGRKKRVDDLVGLFRDKDFMATQKKVLKHFEASKRLCRLVLQNSSDLKNFEDKLEAACCLVDIWYEEANTTSEIISQIAAGDIDLALIRIESFGGTNKQGLQRKCTLYFLCLVELTLLSGKDKPFRKTAIEQLLNHFDKHLPKHDPILNWNDFFPSYPVFLMACEWAELGLDYPIVYQRTEEWNNKWLVDKGPYSDMQFEVMLDCSRVIRPGSSNCSAIRAISAEMAKQGKVEEALVYARGISDEYESDKNRALSAISTELAKQGKVEEALVCARGISDEYDMDKNRALSAIFAELAKQGKVEEAIDCARSISDDSMKSRAFSAISTELAKQGKVEEALVCARGISDEYDNDKNRALSAISTELAKQGKVDEALDRARSISDDWEKENAFLSIITELAKQGRVEEALSCARDISDDEKKCQALIAISAELAKQGKVEEESSVMKKAFAYALGILDDRAKSSALSAISTELAKQGKVEEAFSRARSISSDYWKNRAISAISTELTKQGKVEEALVCARSFSDDSMKSRAISAISTELAKQGKVEEGASVMHKALAYTRGNIDDYHKWSTLESISTELAKQGRVEESFSVARSISDEFYKFHALLSISSELAKQGEKEEAASAIEESLSVARGISDEDNKSRAFLSISYQLAIQGRIEESLSVARSISDESEKWRAIRSISSKLAKQGRIEESFSVARSISDEFYKIHALLSISSELAKQGKKEEAASVIDESLSVARSINDESEKWKALRSISSELIIQGRIEESLSVARVIDWDSEKCMALLAISSELAKQGKKKEAASAIEESLSVARGISDEDYKSRAFESISSELVIQGRIEESLSVARSISDEREKWRALMSISYQLAIQGRMEESFSVARSISDEFYKIYALLSISSELAKQGKKEEAASVIDESLSVARSISDEREKWRALNSIYSELIIQGRIEESLSVARSISDESEKCDALMSISAELAKQDRLTFAEEIGLEITKDLKRQKCWEKMAKVRVEKVGLNPAYENLNILKNEESRKFYLKGWADNLPLVKTDEVLLEHVLPALANYTQSIESVLQKFALHALFLGNADKALIHRLNKTLNIQWALDIHDSFPSNEHMTRTSTNLEDWISELSDEDDRDIIRSFARQVAKGKITEAEFRGKVKEMK